MQTTDREVAFQPAHDWKHGGDMTRCRDGEHIQAACACGCTVWATVVARRVRSVRVAGGDARFCTMTGRDHR
jgi:hypothetical protein